MEFVIKQNELIAKDCYLMTLSGDTSAITAPGQFVQIKLPEKYLRRPISVCDWAKGTLTLIYKVVGQGTQQMGGLPVGTKLDLLTGLGNGYRLADAQNPLLVGGGVGAPPMYALCKALLAKGQKPMVALGFGAKDDAILVDAFEALGVPVALSTVDASLGTKGFVTDAIRESGFAPDYLYACGPEPMLKAVYDALPMDGQFSFEQRMACGFGACMGCTCKTKYGAKRICKDGPVLYREEIIW